MNNDASLSVARTRAGVRSTWAIAEADDKLRWRGSLPGASCFDRAAHVLRMLQAQGASTVDLVPLAAPASWMVNSKASSVAMQRWTSAAARDAWQTLLDAVAFDLSPAGWLALPARTRSVAADAVAGLATGRDGATLAALTKIVALLRPQLVPLMDDAALWFSIECVPEPTSAENPSAPPSAFVPMLDWFAGQVVSQEAELVAIAARHGLAVLDAAQVLDRLIWVESWGHRLRAK
jgi:hypothetical protein